MNLVLTTLNSKYIHPSSALRILKNDLISHGISCDFKEYTIKEDIQKIATDLKDYDIVAMSCYIYNINEIKQLLRKLKANNPHQIIVLGGPEVSFLNENQALELAFDYIVCGEGEQIFVELIQALINKKQYTNDYLIYKDNETVIMNKKQHYVSLEYAQHLVNDFSDIDVKHQITYLETSRGCPYKCSYCQASLDNNVRNFDLEYIFEILDEVFRKEVKIVKFLDRTFNFNVERTNKIIEYIINNDNNITTFQFEITGELLDLSSIELINQKARQGLFRFEIGIQSTNSQANKAIRRYQDFDKLRHIILKIKEQDKVVLHLDLIAGLPFEGLTSFKETFNQVFMLDAKELQLGFLKLLKGTALNEIIAEYNYKFSEEAPFEIIENDFLTEDDIQIIEDVEDALNSFYNKEKARELCNYLIHKYNLNPFDFFASLGKKLSLKMQIYDYYQIILNSSYIKDDKDLIELYKNYYQLNKQRMKSLSVVTNKKEILHDLINEHDLIQNEVFSTSCVEKINEDSYFIYLLDKQKYYLYTKER